MKKIFMAMLLLLTIFFVTGCGSNGTKKIIIGIDDEFPPIAFHNERGELVGFDIDLAKETAKRMGVEFEFKPIDWTNKREEIISGNIDMLWSACDILPKRKEYMIFSKPYMDNRQIFLVKSGNPQGIHSEGDLAGKIVGAKAATYSEDYINNDEYFKDTFAKFVTYRNVTEGLELLGNDELDVILIDEIAGRYAASKHAEQFDAVEAGINIYTEVGIGFRKSDDDLRDKVQKAFDSMIRDGTAKKISKQWFNADVIKTVR